MWADVLQAYFDSKHEVCHFIFRQEGGQYDLVGNLTFVKKALNFSTRAPTDQVELSKSRTESLSRIVIIGVFRIDKAMWVHRCAEVRKSSGCKTRQDRWEGFEHTA